MVIENSDFIQPQTPGNVKMKLVAHREFQDDDYVKYSGKECVSVSRDTPYIEEMEEQMRTIKQKLMEEWWSVRIKWNSHDFWQYLDFEDITKTIYPKDDDIEFYGEAEDGDGEKYEDENLDLYGFDGDYNFYGINPDEVSYEELLFI